MADALENPTRLVGQHHRRLGGWRKPAERDDAVQAGNEQQTAERGGQACSSDRRPQRTRAARGRDHLR